ncbi:DNA polymerase III subunit alpha [Lentibacillus sp. Marseille-P4043]|uniref:DNA polymerase III subunit alpha n=1 Tax=Lentibacillus sp. Marseille-P4043 TaxID=2040293 RepID=UPI000D0B10F8|nr:DNA polymerase III subunit alpha [Lentibacillus sp. Marseille-P4043]
MSSFTHLQVRSGYSLMNSTITIDKLVEKAKDLGFQALALTDEQVLYGAISFYQACKEQGIKPIIGMIVNVKTADGAIDTCILLAKNNQGYQKLVSLSTYLQTNHYDAIEKENLINFTTGVIGILPTSQNSISSILQQETLEKTKEYIDTWSASFDSDDFYLGVEKHGLVSEKVDFTSLKKLHATYQIPVVAINDVRYLNETDDIAYDCLQAMKNGKEWPLRMTNPAMKQHHLRSESEMTALFQAWPEVVYMTEQICGKCTVTFDLGARMLPSFPIPEQLDAHTYLAKVCWNKVEQRYDTVTSEIYDRLQYELAVIKSMQFSDYFLIVWDFVAYAKANHIMVGPGRGSAAGSLVAYVLGITDVDPIKYNLLFERFLNPERITMPDIDIDFSDHRRDEVIEYVRNKYGADHVAQIITFGTFAARSVVRELIKTIGIDKQDAQFILREIPVQAKKTLVEYVHESEDLKQYIKQSEKLKALFKIATILEGLPRHISTHAAGVVISEKPFEEHVPLTVGANDIYLTQFSMNHLETIGLLKMDFLGLRNLTLLERIVQTIYYRTKKVVDLNQLPENDAKTFSLLQKGKTNGIFQLESQGMKQVLTRLRPTAFEDIVAVNALYRPGPMEYISTYIARKHKQEKIIYPHPDLASILEKTYGVLVYQEQIMQIAHKIAGFSLGEADILRRAVSKKQQGVMDEQKATFIKGCLANGYNQTVAEEIFAWIVKFSNYGFNRSHAVAYSMITYQLAYLKAHYPASFFTQILNAVVNQQEKVHIYMKEAKVFDLSVLPPSINKSFGMFSVDGKNIRMGLLSIKGIGNQVVNEIAHARKQGPFKNLFDFCMRVSLSIVNRQVLEVLILSGAFDEIYKNRASMLASIDQAMEQGDLFREFNDEASLFQDKLELEATYIKMEDLDIMEKLANEKELLGVYVSSHPLATYRKALVYYGYVPMSRAQQLIGKRKIKSAVIVQSSKTIRTKRGDPMAFLTISDETGDMEAVVFPDVFRSIRALLEQEKLIFITGKIESRNNRVQWIVQEAYPFEEVKITEEQHERLFIKLSEQNSEEALRNVKETANLFPGSTPIIIYTLETKKTYQLASMYDINPVNECIYKLRDYFGQENVALDKQK